MEVSQGETTAALSRRGTLLLMQLSRKHKAAFVGNAVPECRRLLRGARDPVDLMARTLEASRQLLALWSACAREMRDAGIGAAHVAREIAHTFCASKLPEQLLHGVRLFYRREAQWRRGGGPEGGAAPRGEEEAQHCIRTLRVIGGALLLEDVVIDVLHEVVQRMARALCEDDLAAPALGRLDGWREEVVNPWLLAVIGAARDGSTAELAQRVEFLAYEEFCSARIHGMFDVITEYPESLTALRELKVALNRSRLHGKLATALKATLRQRLLHPGATTHQIIDVYVTTVKSLRLLDPSDQLLDEVAAPIRAYLRQRPDTVRCIVSSLVDDTASDLFAELQKAGATASGQALGESDEAAQGWNPPTWEADISSTAHKGSDVLTLLVSIYGSKKLFVEEYRTMLADKLLAPRRTSNADKEVTNIELLKLKFGEDSMLDCEIMIRDTEESKRVTGNVLNAMSSAPNFNPTIISHHYWPNLRRQEVELHPMLTGILDEYREQYAVIKNPRELEWYKDLGTVDLEVEFDDGAVREYSVSPIEASILMHFSTTGHRKVRTSVPPARRAQRSLTKASLPPPQVTLEEISETLGASQDHVRRCLRKLISLGAMSETRTDDNIVSYMVPHSPREGVDGLDSSTRDDDTMATADGASEEEELLTSYLIGMLKNLRQLPLARIDQLLRTYMQGSYGKSRAELSAFLSKLCDAGRIEFLEGHYQLKS